MPLIYGDVAFDERQGCTIISTEELFVYLARQVPVDSIVMVGEVDGVYDRDPLVDPQAVHIPQITLASVERLQAQLGGSHAVDVTGGMVTKVEAMVSLVAGGHVDRVHLISGRRRGALSQALLGAQECGGTVIERGCEEQERN